MRRLLVLVAMLSVAAAGPASAVTFYVDSTLDAVDAAVGDGICASASGVCTLRAAVTEASALPGVDEVEVPAGVFELSISLGSLAAGDLILRGQGPAQTTLLGNGFDPVVVGGLVRLEAMTVSGGAITSGYGGAALTVSCGGEACILDHVVVRNNQGYVAESGAIYFGGGTWLVSNSQISDNVTTGVVMIGFGNITFRESEISRNGGHGVAYVGCCQTVHVEQSRIEDNGGAGLRLLDSGSKYVSDSIVKRNGGTGIYYYSDGYGGLDVTRSIVADNVDGGVFLANATTSFIRDTLISHNRSATGAGGVEFRDGDIGSLTIENTTIVGNEGAVAGGLLLHAGDCSLRGDLDLALDHTTIVANSATGGAGGISVLASPPFYEWCPEPRLRVGRSAIAGNSAPASPDCLADPPVVPGAPLIGSAGHNLIGDTTGCAFTPAATDLVGNASTPLDPLLAPLADNGGPTPTRALLPGSPLLDSIDGACLATDQRSVARPFDGDGDGAALCDIGAFESADFDGDGIGDLVDDCLLTVNPGQEDADGDGVGDACNDPADADGDEWADALDNCPALSNPSQVDQDGDALGDACDPFPLDADNEQAQCEADLGTRTAELEVCSADLDQCLAQLAAPEVLLETGLLGPEGGAATHFPITSSVFLGARFEVLAPVTTGSVGAHITQTLPGFGGAPGDLFAAIIRLTGPSDYPDSFDLTTPDVVGSALLPLPPLNTSAEVTSDLALPLQPGWYALLLGSGQLGATGGGAATLNNPVIGTPSMFGGFVDTIGWDPGPGTPLEARLFVRTESADLLTCEGDLAECQSTVIEGNGDVNGDGVSDLLDSVLFRRWLAGYPNP